MNHIKACLVFLFLILSIGTANADEQYLCVAEKATGFSYNKATKDWEGANFKAGSKYIISKPKKDDKSSFLRPDKIAFQVTEVGQSVALRYCESGFNELGFLNCTHMLGFSEFKFNKKTGRFLCYYTVGYYHALPNDDLANENSDTPFMEIGKCSPF